MYIVVPKLLKPTYYEDTITTPRIVSFNDGTDVP